MINPYNFSPIQFVVCKCFHKWQSLRLFRLLESILAPFWFRGKKSSRSKQLIYRKSATTSSVQRFTISHMLPFVIMGLLCGECRTRSDCTHVQSDVALHSPLLVHLSLLTNNNCTEMIFG